MKKSVKIIIGVIIGIVVLWGIIFTIDYIRCTNFTMPIFVIAGETTADDGGSGTYYGLGYEVKVEKSISAKCGAELEKVEMYMFDKFITGAIAETYTTTEERTKLSDLTINAEGTNTNNLVKFNGIIYGESYIVIDYAGNMNESIGKIDFLIGEEYLPQLDGETNCEKLLNSNVLEANEKNMVLKVNNVAVLFNAIDEYIKNVTENNSSSTEPYIPNGIEISDNNEIGNAASTQNFNRSPENVTIEVLENTITNESAEILITDNNQDHYGWGADFRVQKKVNDVWEEITPIGELSFIEIAYEVGEDNQLKLKVNYGKYYGTLEKGIYRIVKPIYDKEYIDLYSNEFEIK